MEKGNRRKYLSYKEAYSRMDKAIKNGFYFEAITIQESIISDRLLSFIIGRKLIDINENEIHKNKVSLGNLINATKDFMTEFHDLNMELVKFKYQRNLCVHSLVKSFPGKPTLNVSDIINLSEETCLKGKKLTREVLKWHHLERKKTISIDESLNWNEKTNP